MNLTDQKINSFLNDPRLAGIRYNLQLFAPEDEGRTEEPTEKKLREAREKGQVARTQELPQAAVVIVGILTVLVLAPWIYDSLARMTVYYLSTFSTFHMTELRMRHELLKIILEMSRILLPLFGTVFIAAFFSNIAQVGFQISTHPLKLDWSKIKFDPATIMKKIFFSKQIAMNLFKSIFKVLAIGLISYLIIMSDFDSILMMPDISITMAVKLIMLSSLKIILWASMFMLILAIPDYIFQRREFLDSLKMTKHELKEEWKETMGDPYLRARLREMQREILMKNMIQEVPKADVIVTNPTHFAVALKYDRDTMAAPTLIAKGADSIALKIREIGRDNDIPIIENRHLAREMYTRLEVGDTIPEDLFKAVVYIYRQLHEMKRFKTAI